MSEIKQEGILNVKGIANKYRKANRNIDMYDFEDFKDLENEIEKEENIELLKRLEFDLNRNYRFTQQLTELKNWLQITTRFESVMVQIRKKIERGNIK